MPPQGPAPETTSPTKSGSSLAPLDDRLGHGSPFCRWSHIHKHRRRREHAELKRLLSVETGCTPVEPTRLFANELVVKHGFPVDQAREVLS
jgi:hypothetical protein